MKPTYRTAACLFTLAGLMAAGLTAGGAEQKGAAEIVLGGGNRGDVSFPHQQHQDTLGDCQICHAVFPQQKGAIDTLKAHGRLKPKEVMNKQCTRCHRDRKRAGEKSGPTTCSSCHQKNNG